MFNSNDLFDLVAREGQIARASLRPELSLQDSGLASVDLIRIVLAIEDRFMVEIDDTAVACCGTLGDFADLLQARIAMAPGRTAA
jgi:acyl carrier protein